MLVAAMALAAVFAAMPGGWPTAAVRGDSRAELDERIAKAQERLREHRLDALLLTTEANVRYFTGYHSSFWLSPTRPWFVILPVSGLPTAVIPMIGIDAFARTNVGEVVAWPSPRKGDDGVSELSAALGQVPFGSGHIGAEFGAEMTVRMPLLDLEKVKVRLASRGQKLVDGGDIIKQARLVKSTIEVAKIEATCQAQSAAYRDLPYLLTEGMSEVEVCNAVRRLFLQKGVDNSPYVICRSGPVAYSDIIGQPTERRLQAGDVLIVDSGSQIDGYFCDFNRNFAVGPPAMEVEEAYSQLYEATEAALRVVKPGARFQDVYRSMAHTLNVTAEGGVGRMGHAVGLQLTEWPSIHPDEETVLEEGMVLAIEPSVQLPSGGGRVLVTEEEVVVTQTGCRLLTERAPLKIPVTAAKAEL
mmetsp:Transcript_92296/g.214451  ORF Transcript_92296/g.214451 Transcript_92296/m.214451 type:complete len:415 (+) Transcript_92296:72-1316(+)